jgi:anaerobic selenocysteine-containing dehydrogenase
VDETFDGFWDKVQTDGGWWDAEHQGSLTFQGPSQMFQFAVSQPLVRAPAAEGDAQQFPLLLHLYPSIAFRDGSAANLPWLQEMPDPMTTVMWGSWAEVSPATAERLGVAEGDIVTVRSSSGSIDLPVYVYPGLRPDVVAIPVGQGHQGYGRYAANRGSNPLRLVTSTFDPAAGCVVQNRARVAVSATGRRATLARFGSSEPGHGAGEVHR